MTKYATITYTAEQAEKLVEEYNRYAKSPLLPSQAHLNFHENSEWEMENQGGTHIEISQYETKSGYPETFWICANQVDLVWSELEE